MRAFIARCRSRRGAPHRPSAALFPALPDPQPLGPGVMEPSCKWLCIAAMFVCFASTAGAEKIVSAQYATPVARYGHFALGQPHEYARVRVTTDSGRSLELQLPDDEVFEDLLPRLVRLDAQAPAEILAIVSRRQDGARLVMIRLNGDRLEMSAESPAIGIPMRWLNPVGVVDLDGDGRAEIAIVTTPHIGGTLRVYRRSQRNLVEIASLAGFSNHVYGSPELGLSAPVALAGRMRLLVPDTTRRNLLSIALEGGRLVEVGRCGLPAPVVGAATVVGPATVSVVLSTGQHRITLDDCVVNRVLGWWSDQRTSDSAVVTHAITPPHRHLASFLERRTPQC